VSGVSVCDWSGRVLGSVTSVSLYGWASLLHATTQFTCCVVLAGLAHQ
jgi:hypothetical protein